MAKSAPTTAKKTTTTTLGLLDKGLLRSVLLGPVCAGVMTGAAELPKRVLLARWGRNVARGLGPDGSDRELFVNEKTAAVLAANQEARGFDTVTLDFDHESHKGHANYRTGPITTAGHGSIEVVPGKGLYYLAAAYTPEGRQYAASYPDVSGVFWVDGEGVVTMVSSVALTRNGAVAGAEFKEAIAASVIAANARELAELPDALTLMRDLLGYTDEATEDDVRLGLGSLLRARRAAGEPEEGQKAAGGEVESTAKGGNEISGVPAKPVPVKPGQQQQQDDETTKGDLSMSDIKTLEEGLKALTDAVGKLMAGQTTLAASVAAIQSRDDTTAHNAGVEAVITASIAAGKVVPACVKAKSDQGRYVMSVETAKEVMEAIPATVAVENGRGGGVVIKPRGLATGAMTEAEETVAAMLGIDEAAWKKGSTLVCVTEPPVRGAKID